MAWVASAMCLFRISDLPASLGAVVVQQGFGKSGLPRRLVINCDQNDYRHAHEEQPSGIYTWWSDDDGATWDGPHPTGIPGIEPDHVVELDDGTLLMGTHFMRGDTQKLAEAVARSTDGGKTWGDVAIIASDNVHEYCEGAIVPLASGRLVCIMRENNHINYPSYLSFSSDGGRSPHSGK